VTILVTGAGGQLGRALRPLLPDAVFAASADLDITDRAAVGGFDWTGVTGIVNAAAWTAVDAAESTEHLHAAWDANATGVAHLAAQARRLDVPLVHVSTDYVLRGNHTGDAPVDAALDPQGAYGATKAAGEMAAALAPRHYIVRTSWVFGDGPNFVRTMLRVGADRSELTVVDDQVGRPTYAVDLAGALVALLGSDAPYGTYCATGSGDVVSWAGFAAAVLEGTDCRVVPVSTAEYLAKAPQAAARPANSALDLEPLARQGIRLRDWREALRAYLSVERERAQS
jgi:dTDP-4-dehydrorhamnose reductase